jgi:hypothetical protein
MYIALIILLLPFLQLGLSYWASVALIMALIMTVLNWPTLVKGFTARWYVLLVVPLMFLSVVFNPGDFSQDFLRVAREALFLVLIVCIVQGAGLRQVYIDPKLALRGYLFLTASIALLTLFQARQLARGVYFGFPAELYAQGVGTIPTELDLMYSNLRPAATFSEPSYLAFILLSLLFSITYLIGKRKVAWFVILLILFSGLMSRAASFFLLVSLFGAVACGERLSWRGRALLIPAALLALAGIILFGSESSVLARLMDASSPTGDYSIFVRIFGPLQALPYFPFEFPFGVPLSQVPQALLPYALPYGLDPEEYITTGLFNFIFEFGIVAIPIAAILFWVRDRVVAVYLVCATLFNGSFLAVDKYAVISFAVVLYYSFKRQAELEAKDQRRSSNVARPRMTRRGRAGSYPASRWDGARGVKR